MGEENGMESGMIDQFEECRTLTQKCEYFR
jgi:hypothetical protein